MKVLGSESSSISNEGSASGSRPYSEASSGCATKCFGSGAGFDPDSIRSVDLDPYSESGTVEKVEKITKFHVFEVLDVLI